MRNTRSLCLQVDLVNTGGDKEISRGIIDGQLQGWRYDAKLRSGFDVRMGGFVIGPRAGLDAAFTRLGASQESETPFGTNYDAGIDGAGESPIDGYDWVYNTTGAALAVNAQSIFQLQGRLGFFTAMPFQVNSATVTPFVEASWVHEFANNQRDIVARFAGDMRGTGATYFSFKSDKPDRDFFEINGGVSFAMAGVATATIGGRTILGNSHFDSYTIEGSLRIPF